MNLSFWEAVASNWRNIEKSSEKSVISLDLLLKTVEEDIKKSNELVNKWKNDSIDEVINDDDFWGGL